MKKLLSLIAILTLSLTLTSCIGNETVKKSDYNISPSKFYVDDSAPNLNIGTLEELQQALSSLYETMGDTAVGISCTNSIGESSIGSGVVYAYDDSVSGQEHYRLVTNDHVIDCYPDSSILDQSIELRVHFTDGYSVEASLNETDAYLDLAVLSFETNRTITPIVFADSNDIAVGNLAVAIGNPYSFDLSNTYTFGMISGVNRFFADSGEDDLMYIQHDVAISPGNSGGGLFDLEGRLVGINVKKVVADGFDSIGFSIPVDTVIRAIATLETGSKITRGALAGVSVTTYGYAIDDEEFNLPTNVDTGAVVQSVVANSASSEANISDGSTGLLKNDVITHVEYTDIDGNTTWIEIKKHLDLVYEIKAFRAPNEVVKFKINRNNVELEATLTLKSSN